MVHAHSGEILSAVGTSSRGLLHGLCAYEGRRVGCGQGCFLLRFERNIGQDSIIIMWGGPDGPGMESRTLSKWLSAADPEVADSWRLSATLISCSPS